MSDKAASKGQEGDTTEDLGDNQKVNPGGEMAQETNQSQAPLLCTTGCGFYGNPRNNGMCSVCYKDFLQRQNSNGRVSPPVSSSAVSSLGESLLAQCSESSTVDVPSAAPPTDTATGQTSVVSSPALLTPASILSEESPTGVKDGEKTDDVQASVSAESSVESQDKPVDKPKAKKARCFLSTCRKKVGLTGFDCRCGNVFCSMHRYSDVHNCTFDYKADAAEKIRKENPVIVGEKIQKI